MNSTTAQPSALSKMVTMYTGVLSGTDTNSGDRILVFVGLASAVGLFLLPGYWKLLAIAAPVVVYSMASQS